jgi:hypothetical protein
MLREGGDTASRASVCSMHGLESGRYFLPADRSSKTASIQTPKILQFKRESS